MADAKKKNPKYNIVPISSPTFALVAPSSSNDLTLGLELFIWGDFMVTWVGESLINDCSDANQNEEGAWCGMHCFCVIVIGKL